MIIIHPSSKKDYFYRIANMYGGGDPKVVYRIKRDISFTDTLQETQLNDALKVLLILNTKVSILHINNDNDVYSLVVICGKAFLIQRKKFRKCNEYDEVQNRYFPVYEFTERVITDTDFLNSNSKLFKRHYLSVQSFDLTKGLFDKYFEHLCIKLEQPIIHITISRSYNGYTVYVLKDVPNLEQLGFPTIISAEQMYQTVADFVANKLTFPNHMAEVTNNDKIIKHGFNEKSFRKEKTKK